MKTKVIAETTLKIDPAGMYDFLLSRLEHSIRLGDKLNALKNVELLRKHFKIEEKSKVSKVIDERDRRT